MRTNYIKVENIYLYDLANAEFINFMRRFMALLPLVDDGEGGQHAPALAITKAMVAEGKASLASMEDLNRESRLKAETKPKKEIDRLRDRMIAYIIARIALLRDSPDNAVCAAAEQLYIVANPYKGAGRLPYNQETEVIRGFLFDMDKDENIEAVRALGIEGDLDQLRSYNDQFEALVQGADTKSSTSYFNEKMRDLRVSMGDWYQEMADRAFASNLLNESEESLYFLAGLNTLIADVKTAYKQRGARKTAEQQPAEDETPGGDAPAGEGAGGSGLEFVPVEKD